MGIGIEREWEQSSWLGNWVYDSGIGISGITAPEDIPSDCIEFIKEQFLQIDVQTPTPDIIAIIALRTFLIFDFWDPYLMFDFSDVVITSHWATNVFEIHPPGNKTPFEADPESLETFAYVPGGDIEFFEENINKKSLDELPMPLGDVLRDVLSDDFCYGCMRDEFSPEDYEYLEMLCVGENGIVDGERVRFYIEFIAWAFTMWYLGPFGKNFRNTYNDICYHCYKEGATILYEGEICSKDFWLMYDRPPVSCVECGLDAWCVEMVHIEGVTRNVCEAHLNGSAPMIPGLDCGSKVCKYVSCPNHPQFGQEGALLDVYRKRGQLNNRRDEYLRIQQQNTNAGLLA